jgi:hypothetical protein
MPTLVQLYEEHALDCARAADLPDTRHSQPVSQARGEVEAGRAKHYRFGNAGPSASEPNG